MNKRRSYAMAIRAEAAAATRENILAATRRLLEAKSVDQITLDSVASDAGTTVRTVLRTFGSKDLLLAATLDTFGDTGHGPVHPGDIARSVNTMFAFYEKHGEMVIRWLADEPRLPAMREHLEIGRRHLRFWVNASFAPDLDGLAKRRREEALDALIVAFDVYTWKLLRRDMGLSAERAKAVVRRVVEGLVARGVQDGKDAVAELVRRR